MLFKRKLGNKILMYGFMRKFCGHKHIMNKFCKQPFCRVLKNGIWLQFVSGIQKCLSIVFSLLIENFRTHFGIIHIVWILKSVRLQATRKMQNKSCKLCKYTMMGLCLEHFHNVYMKNCIMKKSKAGAWNWLSFRKDCNTSWNTI